MEAPLYDVPPTAALRRLSRFLADIGSELSTTQAATAAIEDWIAAQRMAAGPVWPGRGYQWKNLFLPEGTLLRIHAGQRNHTAQVLEDALVYDGRPVSPAQMARSVGGRGRNAWRDAWLLFPGERTWLAAARCRREAATTPVPQPMSPAAATAAAAACMSEALKSALALVDHVNASSTGKAERRQRGARRADDRLADQCRFD